MMTQPRVMPVGVYSIKARDLRALIENAEEGNPGADLFITVSGGGVYCINSVTNDQGNVVIEVRSS